MHWFFGFFLLSGFCSLLYQVVWLRLAMASFGVTTPVISLVLSLFMAGLGLGSWWSGRFVRRLEDTSAARPLALYATVEALIGVSALAAPATMALGRETMRSFEGLGSLGYYALSALWLMLAILPWTVCMGATFPFAMAAIRKGRARESSSSFSYLYVANLIGALLGTLVSAFVMIELLGFRGTLRVAMCLNGVLALGAFLLSRTGGMRVRQAALVTAGREARVERTGSGDWLPAALLFTTGACSMAMEVVWVRQFTPYLGTVVYAFASILAIYLVSTWAGSWLYRRRLKRSEPAVLGPAWTVVGLFSLLTLVSADHRWSTRWLIEPGAYQLEFGVLPAGMLGGLLRVALGIVPLCATLGYLTPMLVDRWSGGDPDRAGAAYSVNVLGSLLGPLLAGFVLLPLFGERVSLFLLALPLFVAGLGAARSAVPRLLFGASALLAAACLLGTHMFEDQFEVKEVRHDSTATVIATGTGMERTLLVNGVGITHLTPMTKIMAHLPMAWRTEPPRNALVICFGMGTTFRSLCSWGTPTVGVELVPSVPELFPFFFDDARELLGDPQNRVVVDDGRRFLERTEETFDVITLDPPPPPEAAGSSLLYSVEFNRAVKARLAQGGILQQWCPSDDAEVQLAIWQSLEEVFEHVLVFRGMDGWGFHYLASDAPLSMQNAEELTSRTPPAAQADMIEWGPETSAKALYERMLGFAFANYGELAARFAPEAIRDDRPRNEYFFLRRLRRLSDEGSSPP